MMVTAKMLVPGIHTKGKEMAWEGKTLRGISVAEAESIAASVCDILDIPEMMAEIRGRIVRLAA